MSYESLDGFVCPHCDTVISNEQCACDPRLTELRAIGKSALEATIRHKGYPLDMPMSEIDAAEAEVGSWMKTSMAQAAHLGMDFVKKADSCGKCGQHPCRCADIDRDIDQLDALLKQFYAHLRTQKCVSTTE